MEDNLKELDRIAKDEARKILSRSGGHEIDDVGQTSMEEYLNYSARNVVENPGALIRIIARRRAWKFRDKWEARRADVALDRKRRADDGAQNDGVELPVGPGDLVAAMLTRSEAELINYAVNQLDPADSEIIRLTYLSDPPRTAPEVAERVGLAAGTVRNRLVELRRVLARMLDADQH